MASHPERFSDAMLGQLSQIGIEIFNEKDKNEFNNLLPRAIYEITKHSSINIKRVNRGKIISRAVRNSCQKSD